ncbi:hypothetical protein LX64_02718 [Chitinophaga skermanii]|uniref:Uncharacterized protein n=1 Tax=Chitinophaga skermanii TaxID=331697 RepID=A0A327QHM3_9BACT|nr:hypothetical protein [Chitinophaga skermanii]RAJ03841.1 hypothetical protein LX64_02718 [Chitinophaga skermanii]
MKSLFALLAVSCLIAVMHANKDKIIGIQASDPMTKLAPYKSNNTTLPSPSTEEEMVMVPDSVYQASRLDPARYTGHYHVLYVQTAKNPNTLTRSQVFQLKREEKLASITEPGKDLSQRN